MKPFKRDFEISKGYKIPATFQLIRHKNNSETLICIVTLDDGQPFTMEAKLSPPNKSRKYWLAKCGGWETGANENGTSEVQRSRYSAAMDLFRTNIEFANSIIEADKYVEVTIRIPKEDGCVKCPMLNDSGFADWKEEKREWHKV
jgi:hypothetical protein